MTAMVAFMSQKGGVGKTSLARSLAVVCAKAKLKVVLIDLDNQQYSLVRWLEARERFSVSPRLTVKAFEHAPEAIDAINDGPWDVAIIDMPGGVSTDTLIVARAVHLIVLPTGPTLDDLYPTVILFHELVRIGIAKEHLVAALCHVYGNGDEEQAREYIEEGGYEVLKGSIPEKAAYRNAHNSGRTLTETDIKVCNTRANELMKSIIEKLGSFADADEEDPGKKQDEYGKPKGHVA